MDNKPHVSLLSSLKSAFTSAFGQLHWNSPPWLTHLKQRAKTSPKSFWGSAGFIFILLLATGYSIYWYKHRPQPDYITASIIVPEITPNGESLVPNNLFIDFGIQKKDFISQVVAPIGQVGKVVTQGVGISPKIEGQWMWNSDSQLLFTPSQDWPAGQKYTITFAPGFFAPQALLKSHEASFTTKPFKAKITEFKFYQDPTNPKISTAVASIQFNFPVDPESLQKNTSLMFQALKQGTQNLKAKALAFSFTYDKNKRVAYLHSEEVKPEESARYILLSLNKNISSSTGSGSLNKEETKSLLIPDRSNVLQVLSSSASIVRNEKDRPEQVLTVETSLGINEKDFNQSVHVYILPQDYPATANEPAKEHYQWQNPGEVTPEILAKATLLNKEPIPTEQNYSSLHSFTFSAQTPAYLYIKIDKGMKAFGDFSLNSQYANVIAVPEFPKEISFLHQGSLLALGGEKKLSLLIRGVPAVQFHFARVLPNTINQLVTQTQGDFNNPFFINPTFNQQNISQIFRDIQQFESSDLSKQQYTALDLGKYLESKSNTLGPQGLFLLQATGWDVANKVPLDVKASRLILMTDLGMLVKDNSDGSHDLFVNSITQGIPVAQATVTVLGKNGLPILSRVTDAQGRVSFPNLKDFVEDREPVVYLASLNNDVSFIPYNNYNRQLNFSKFDIGGIYTNNQETQLSAFLFSDRGIYRPGDTAHIAMIVKQSYVQTQPAGLPLQATIVDPRGTTLKDQKISLNETGYLELEFPINPNAPTGQYLVNLFLVKDDHPQNLLGSTSLRVAEFQPDRMRIHSNFSPKASQGWISPNDLKAEVSLWNLYGAPAANRRISAKMALTPKNIVFENFPNYVFVDPLIDPKKPPKPITESLGDLKTNDQGLAEFHLNLNQYEHATYELTFFAEGFEAQGGRSVTTQSKALVSPLPYFIGYKTDGDLSFIKQNSDRKVQFIAINPQLDKEGVKDLKMQWISLHPVTTLVKKPNGTYQYQSIIQSTVLETKDFSIDQKGTEYSLPTDKIGHYSLSILDAKGTALSQFKFNIVGASQQPLSKNAELSVTLNKSEYKANETIELQITAPYTGSGLITLERDKVYAAQWFKASTNNSVQTITIPADFQGNGYVNVVFVRDWNSPDLFLSPLSYQVLPFTVNHDQHKIQIELQAPKLAHPGEAFPIAYQSDKAGKIIVFAVDEGILQTGAYETPDPLAFFFQKHALEVLTQQTLDQILPKFIQDREVSAAGGDVSAKALFAGFNNPFKRKTDLPVVFWSGIMDTDQTKRQMVYPIPDYFNGSLKIMAVAVSMDSVGSKDTSAEVRGHFVISPNVPTFVAPGDVFEITASIANNIKDSGAHTEVTVELKASPELKIVDQPTQTLEIAQGHEQTVHFKLAALSSLGSAKVNLVAKALDKSSTMGATLSVRPPTPQMMDIQSGLLQKNQKSLALSQTFYPQYHIANLLASSSPLILLSGLQTYLKEYPYGCTEQLTSKGLLFLAMNSQSLFVKDSEQIDKQVNAVIQMLGQRQMSTGGFSYWPGLGENQGNNFSSVYAMHFLTEARAQGLNVPSDLFANGLRFLKNLVSQNPSDMETARIQAYAIYLLTRNELLTTNYLANLQLYLQNKDPKTWQKDIAAVYLAASYQLLKSYEDANQLIQGYEPQNKQTVDTDFFNSHLADAQYLYILAKHFPQLLSSVDNKLLLQLIEAMNTDELSTLFSGYMSLALTAYPTQEAANTASSFSITEILNDNQKKSRALDQAAYQKLDLDAQVKQIILNNPEQKPYFYQLTQSGFDKILPTSPVSKGLEVIREYRDDKGQAVHSVALGKEIEVHIQVRTLDADYLSNVVIEDLLPGGFEVVRESVKAGSMDFADAREDRVNYFGMIERQAKEVVYKIKATNVGRYKVPPVYAQAMYHPELRARGIGEEISVE